MTVEKLEAEVKKLKADISANTESIVRILELYNKLAAWVRKFDSDLKNG